MEKLKIDDASGIVARMKAHFRINSHAELARKLNVPKGTVTNWVQRNTVPYEACAGMVLFDGADLRWLLLGEPAEPIASPPASAPLPTQVKEDKAPEKPPRPGAPLLAILELMERVDRPISEAELSTQLEIPATELHELMQVLYRRGMICRVEQHWKSIRGAAMRADSQQELEAGVDGIAAIFNQEIVPAAKMDHGVVVVGELRVGPVDCGRTILATVREAVEKLHEPSGRLRKIIIGVAPAD